MTDDQLPVGSPMGWTPPEPPPAEPAGAEHPSLEAGPGEAAPSSPEMLAAVGSSNDGVAAAPGGAIGPDGWTTPPAPPAKRRFGVMARLLVPAIIVLVVVGGVVFRDRISGKASDIKPGDCFDDPVTASQAGGAVKDVQHHPCSEPHLFEVIETFTFPTSGGSAFPGDAALDTFIQEKCPAAFASYVGIPADQSSLGYTAYVPGQAGWAKGDRDVTCFLGMADGSSLTGSMKNARR